MDLNRVAAFARVVHDGSFTGAAKALGVPKSSVSRSVAQLEQELGARLLHRTTRKLHLTEAGSAFYERVSRALTDIEEARVVAEGTQAEPRGTVRVTSPLDVGVWALAGIVSRFVKKHPAIRIELSLSTRVVDMVAERIDLAVRAGAIQDESLVARRIGAIDLGLYASARWVKKHGLPASPSELADFPCILFRPANGHSILTLVAAGGRAETVRVSGPLGCDDLSFMKKAALAGGGIGLIPEFICAREEESGKLVRVLPEWSHSGSDLHVAYPSARFLPHRVAVVRDHLVTELSSLFARCKRPDGRPGRRGSGGRLVDAR